MSGWNSSLETGIPIVDEQHQELFRQVDILLDRNNKERVPETLAFLGEYVIKHFGTEELMQKASKYPKAAEHKVIHENFIKTFVALKGEYESGGEDFLVLIKITKIALDWLQEHIGGHDKDFGAYFKASGLATPDKKP
jgi:hemerythrin-like metal-binding protein